MDRALTIGITSMYPDRREGIFKRDKLTRSLTDDETSFGNPWNGMEYTVSDCRHGADPPKNDSGMFGPVFSIDDMRTKSVSTGNGSCIPERMVLESVPAMPTSWILRMRSLCLSAARTLVMDHGLMSLTCMMIGRAGQTPSILRAGLPGLAV
jgi:hypothetical protein